MQHGQSSSVVSMDLAVQLVLEGFVGVALRISVRRIGQLEEDEPDGWIRYRNRK